MSPHRQIDFTNPLPLLSTKYIPQFKTFILHLKIIVLTNKITFNQEKILKNLRVKKIVGNGDRA